MKKIIFLSTKHALCAIILSLCLISTSSYGMFTKQKLSPTAQRTRPIVKRPIQASVVQQLKPEKLEERSEFLEHLKQKQLKQERLERKNKQK